ncbi:hypothetical protein [Flavobacterium nitrogenifigens]|uniref:LPXTG-motif cell wall anchor domain-containing protein n=1 Tax=Flavobacterium nitrogenifigens TaxID=1617283 RepID=A0A521D3P2_9FLAO|nr:hypothetical protein [Flavobacterium nitrogenifigens]KAF2332680.1 hypothetical protein DM397_10215 [Flavobacterium nitrogenifigens]SMO66315.1 hypothetical protein SAMN06265220_102998 [Flavobacterium nitrogenifigens]
MKNLKAPFLVIALLLLLNVSVLFAKDNPLPVPTQKVQTQDVNPGDADPEDSECPPGSPCGPEDFPIDQNISFLLAGALALGGVVLYKNQTKKASI